MKSLFLLNCTAILGILFTPSAGADTPQEVTLRRLSRAVEQAPADANALVTRGMFYLWVNFDFEKALADFNAALAIDPKIAKAYVGRADVYTGRDTRFYDPAKGLADAEKALELAPEMSEAHRIRGDMPSHPGVLGDEADGLKHYLKAIELDPNNFLAHISAGSVYNNPESEHYDPTKAMEHVRQAAELAPNESIAFEALAALLSDEKETQGQALSMLNRAAELNQNNVGALLARAFLYLTMSFEEEALKIVGTLGKEPLGVIDSVRGRRDLLDKAIGEIGEKSLLRSALRDLEDAEKICPFCDDVYVARALLLQNFPGQEREAYDNYTKAVELNPRNPQNLLNRVEFLQDHPHLLARAEDVKDLPGDADASVLWELLEERLPEAAKQMVADCGKAIAIDPKLAHAYLIRGKLQAETMGDFKAAIDDMNLAVGLAPDVASYLEARADVFEASGRDDEADLDREKAASLRAID